MRSLLDSKNDSVSNVPAMRVRSVAPPRNSHVSLALRRSVYDCTNRLVQGARVQSLLHANYAALHSTDLHSTRNRIKSDLVQLTCYRAAVDPHTSLSGLSRCLMSAA